MHIKQTKERDELVRQKMQEAGFRGLQVLDYQGEGSLGKWEKKQAAKRLGNHIKDQTTRGKGAGSAGARHVAKETD